MVETEESWSTLHPILTEAIIASHNAHETYYEEFCYFMDELIYALRELGGEG
jgi:hypothetical protein